MKIVGGNSLIAGILQITQKLQFSLGKKIFVVNKMFEKPYSIDFKIMGFVKGVIFKLSLVLAKSNCLSYMRVSLAWLKRLIFSEDK
jgi:hypothetical protein